ncbi:PEP-CTERM sorting domain-containing protein [Methylomonas sp. SURF-2]|uniref:PEP-CTERM sorting domain-containing protein n=1 Tax=Methylomonas subterranea TaxID=2952225 RepID=A0ABT1TIQ6_9GAMM|nr:PEP-CTERM sorting domain-containing protein [Methylomonas sp. SURF-2]MCQ8105344.1 PEP-CTERM sorting domain-containing protein [Methylomonas sp. SURF-2]
MIDNFSTAQSVLNGSSGPVNIGNSQLDNLTRIITASPSSADAETSVSIKKSFLNISNDSDSIGTASIFYSFDAIDLASAADGLVLKIVFLDLSAEIQVIANEISLFGFSGLGEEKQFEINFSQFSDPAVFTNLTSLRLNFRGAQSWDARFGSLAASDRSAVPEPSILLLFLIGLVMLSQFGVVGRGIQFANASRVLKPANLQD